MRYFAIINISSRDCPKFVRGMMGTGSDFSTCGAHFHLSEVTDAGNFAKRGRTACSGKIDEAAASGDCHGLGPVRRAEFPHDVVDMEVYRPLADVENDGNVP